MFNCGADLPFVTSDTFFDGIFGSDFDPIFDSQSITKKNMLLLATRMEWNGKKNENIYGIYLYWPIKTNESRRDEAGVS